MARFPGELGLQFVSQLASHYTVPDLVRLAGLAQQKGFQQIWVSDNLGSRSQMLVLAAIAAQVPIRVGTAVLVPYFHNPVHLADSLATLSELCEGKEISIGIARGNLAQTSQHMEVVKPIAMVRETTQFLRRALAGQEVAYAEFPLLCDYYHLNRNGKFRLAFEPRSTYRFYGGGNGPQSLRMCGRIMDGLISSGTFIPMLRSGRLVGMLERADQAARDTDPDKKLRRICELNVSISRDRAQAIEFPKRQVAHSILQWEALKFSPEEYATLGVQREKVVALQERFASGATIEEAATLVNEDMVRAYYAAGKPAEVVEQILDIAQAAIDLDYDQITFAKLGPNYEDAIELLANEVVPALRREISSAPRPN